MNTNILFLKLVLFSLILLPSLSVIPGLPSLRVDDVLLIVWLFIFLIQDKASIPSLATSRLNFLLGIIFLFPLSMLNGVLNGYAGSHGDFNQFFRFSKYVAMYLLAAAVWRKLDERASQKLLLFVVLCGIALFLISVCQYFDLLGLNKYYVHIVAPTQYDTLINDYPTPRPVGMIGNPNELGFMFLLLFFVALLCMLYSQEKIYKFALVIFFFGVLMTMSRGAFLALVAGFLSFMFVYTLNQRFSRKLNVLLFALLLVIVFSLIAMSPPVYEAFTWRIERVLDLSSDDSFQIRLDNWSENIAIIKQHPFLGVGPLRRADFEHAADNEWLLVWRSYGIIGVGFIIAFFSSSIFKKMLAPMKSLYLALVCASFLYMIPAVVFHSLTLFPLMLFLLAFIDIRGTRKEISS